MGSCFLNHVMDSLSSSASTVPSIDDYFEHNVWNLVLEMLFRKQVSGIFASYLVEIDLAKFALSCHFALDLYVTRKRCLPLHDDTLGTTAHGVPYVSVATLCFSFLYLLLLVHFSLVYVRIHLWL